jgi:hypothetical protein
MSLLTDGLPAWWAMIVAVAALLVGVWLGELHGRGVGRGQVREDRAAERAVRQVRSWREGRGERTAAFLYPPELHHEAPGYMRGIRIHANGQEVYDWQHDDPEPYDPEAAALALAREDFSVTAWTQQMGEDMDAWLARLLAEHPAPNASG